MKHGEYRKSDRIQIKIPVFYQTTPQSPWNGPLKLINLGGHGLCFQSHKIIPAKTILSFRIELPDGKNPIIAKGKVIWIKHPSSSGSKSVGAKFLKMEKPDRQRFIKYICANILDLFLDDKGKLK